MIDDLIMYTSHSVVTRDCHYDSKHTLRSERTVHERSFLYLRNKS